MVWDGSPIDGRRVLVRCYHGLGDTIQFVRYAPMLRRRAREVVFWVQPRLLRLLARTDGIDRLLPLHDGHPGIEVDVDVEVMELPYLFRTTLATVPDRVPYIRTCGVPLSRAGGPAAGLVWRAGDWDRQRSIPVDVLTPLLDLPVTWHVLQAGETSHTWCGRRVIPHGDAGMDRTAQVIASLDLLITIDSMPAHLAGALGTPVWTLLSSGSDWRWMSTRDDSPWYPSMRLFRRNETEDWDTVIARVRAALLAHDWSAPHRLAAARSAT
jgi:hypothetical protein